MHDPDSIVAWIEEPILQILKTRPQAEYVRNFTACMRLAGIRQDPYLCCRMPLPRHDQK